MSGGRYPETAGPQSVVGRRIPEDRVGTRWPSPDRRKYCRNYSFVLLACRLAGSVIGRYWKNFRMGCAKIFQVMHSRRLACLLLGLWFGGGAFMQWISTENYRAVDRL